MRRGVAFAEVLNCLTLREYGKFEEVWTSTIDSAWFVGKGEGMHSSPEDAQASREFEFCRLIRRLDLLADDMRVLKNFAAESATERRYEALALELGFNNAKLVGAHELYGIANSATDQDEGRDAIRSLRSADFVIRARDAGGSEQYIVVESSHTIDGWDTRRVLSNAETLSRATAVGTTAVVSGYEIDEAVRGEVESGAVSWYQLEPDDLRPR